MAAHQGNKLNQNAMQKPDNIQIVPKSSKKFEGEANTINESGPLHQDSEPNHSKPPQSPFKLPKGPFKIAAEEMEIKPKIEIGDDEF